MYKRAAEDAGEEGPAKKAAPGKGSGGGQRAEEVVNPIPRQFKTNSITLHFTQRTWEEIGPGDLKYFPICQNPLILMDKFHIKMFNKFFPLCSTYEIHQPKVRISNILMLQDNLTTQAGTPKSDTIYTQACYLLMFTPNRMNNWFKLGITQDCMETQKILYSDWNPFKKQQDECTLVTQLATMQGGYTDFEHLTINPAKPYFTGGWDNKMNFVVGEREALEDQRDIIVTNNYIPPINNSKFNQFSCSLRGTDLYIPIGEHTTMARNLDTISLHKYGDEISFEPETNLNGMKLINDPLNNLLSYEITSNTKPSDLGITSDPDEDFRLVVNYQLSYPSNNRPFFTRKDNLSTIGPVEGTKEIGHLRHRFLTMPPIKKKDGSLLQQRASFQLEQTMSVTFHFPETTSDEGSSKWMLNQANGVILRPSINYIKSVRDGAKPTPPPDKIELPKPYPFPEYNNCISTVWGIWTMLKDNVVKKLIRDNGYCLVIGHYDQNGKFIPRNPEDNPKFAVKYMSPDQLPAPEVIPEDRGYENFYESLLPLNDKEILYAKGTTDEQRFLHGTLFALFCQTMLYTKKGLREMKAAPSLIEDMPYVKNADEATIQISTFFKERLHKFQTDFYGEDLCPGKVIRVPMGSYKQFKFWPRLQPDDPIAQQPSVFNMELLPHYNKDGYLSFYMVEYIDYLAKMGVGVLPKKLDLVDFYLRKDLEKYPVPKKHADVQITDKYEIFYV